VQFSAKIALIYKQNYSKTLSASFFISLSISFAFASATSSMTQYRAKALLPHSLIGIRTSRLVVGSSTVTTRLIPVSRKTSLMASLYFCSEMKGRIVALTFYFFEESHIIRLALLQHTHQISLHFNW